MERLKDGSKAQKVGTESLKWDQHISNPSSVIRVPSSISVAQSKKSLLLRNLRKVETECQTYLKVGQMSSNPKYIVPFVIEWVPNLLPRMGIGEVTITFEFGHQKNGQVHSFHEGSLSR